MKETTPHQQATAGLCQTSMVIGYDTTVEILTRLDFEQAGRLLKALIFYGYLNYGRGNAELCPTRTEYDDAGDDPLHHPQDIRRCQCRQVARDGRRTLGGRTQGASRPTGREKQAKRRRRHRNRP